MVRATSTSKSKKKRLHALSSILPIPLLLGCFPYVDDHTYHTLLRELDVSATTGLQVNIHVDNSELLLPVLRNQQSVRTHLWRSLSPRLLNKFKYIKTVCVSDIHTHYTSHTELLEFISHHPVPTQVRGGLCRTMVVPVSTPDTHPRVTLLFTARTMTTYNNNNPGITLVF